MAKRARGTTTRPGQRAPLAKAAGRPTPLSTPSAPAPKPVGLTDAEEARAAELEARIVADERAADDTRRRNTERGRRAAAAAAGEAEEPARRQTTSLAVRAADEYAYVGRDVRRITLLGGSLFLILIALWVIAHLTGTGPI